MLPLQPILNLITPVGEAKAPPAIPICAAEAVTGGRSQCLISALYGTNEGTGQQSLDAVILTIVASSIDIPGLIEAGPVTLRPLTREDRPRIHRWLNDPAVMPFWSGSDRPLSETESVEWVGRFLGKSMALRCLVIETPERPVGFIELARNPDDHNYGHLAEIDICIGEPAEWERGYGSAALRALLRWLFTEARIQRAFLQPRASNERALRVCEKVGFRREGVLRRADYGDGVYHDVVMMAALRDEWLADFGDAWVGA